MVRVRYRLQPLLWCEWLILDALCAQPHIAHSPEAVRAHCLEQFGLWSIFFLDNLEHTLLSMCAQGLVVAYYDYNAGNPSYTYRPDPVGTCRYAVYQEYMSLNVT